MKETNGTVALDWQPDRQSGEPVYRQIIDHMAAKIARGDWTVGSRIPSQRQLAARLGVNRSTVAAALEELISFGVLEALSGSCTRVSSNSWSLMMTHMPPNWGEYLRSGSFQENQPTIQEINRLEFVPGIIRLGTGELSPALYPRELMARILSELPAAMPSLNYLEPLGLPELRHAVSARLAERGVHAPPECILITSGSLQALQLISVGMLGPGAAAFTEEVSYLKSLRVFQSAGIELHGLPMDGEGLSYWRLPKPDERPQKSILYTIPSFHNPTGALMSAARRSALYHYCRESRLPIIEDDAYGELWLESPPPAPIKAEDKNGLVLYLGTLSKTIAPGLRIGWLVGPQSVVQRLGDIKMQIDYGASSVSQWMAAKLLASGEYDRYLTTVRAELRRRRDFALAALARYFTGLAKWSTPQGGFYIWLTLSGNISTSKLFHAALERNILLNPGNIYGFQETRALRISYAYAEPADFESGLRTLAEIVREM